MFLRKRIRDMSWRFGHENLDEMNSSEFVSKEPGEEEKPMSAVAFFLRYTLTIFSIILILLSYFFI